MPFVLIMLIGELTIGACSNVRQRTSEFIEGIEAPINIFRWLFKVL